MNPFSLDSVYVTAGAAQNLQATFTGSLNGVTTKSFTVNVSDNAATVVQPMLGCVDTVVFNGVGGTRHPGCGNVDVDGINLNLVVLDNMSLSLSG